MKSHRTAYPYAYDGGGRLGDHFNVRSIPFAVLVDPDGIVQWTGHPARLDEATVARALAFAIAEPISGWPKSTVKLQLLLKQGRYAPALSAATALGEPYKSFVADRVQAKVKAVQEAHGRGDFLAASELGERAAKELAGLREAMEVKGLVDRIKRDREMKRVLDGQKRVRDLARSMSRLRHTGEVAKLRGQLSELAREFEGTVAGTQAEAWLGELERRTQKR